MLEAVSTSETLVSLYDTMWLSIPEDCSQKGELLNSLERYVFHISKDQIHMSDFNVGYNNPIFEIIYWNFPNRWQQ
jgi:hypothetical protein